MGYHETLYNSYPSFIIRIDGEFQGENDNYPISKNLEKETHAGSDAAFGTKEAARRLGCSPGQVRELVHENQIGHKRIGKNIRFTSGQIDEFLRSEPWKSQIAQGGKAKKRGKRISEKEGVKNTGVSRTDLKGRLSTWD
ncbi:MAG: helix-turn-helix domain-containing protein [Desulfomonilaceae bacterium]